MKNVIGNAFGVLVYGLAVNFLASHFTLFEIYATSPFPARILMAFVGIMIAFIFIIWLKETALRNAIHHEKVAKTIFYPFALVFLAIDVLFNIVYSPIFLLGSTANSYREGWTFTSHCKAVRDVSMAEMEFRDLDKIETLRLRLALFYGRIMNSIEEGHF